MKLKLYLLFSLTAIIFYISCKKDVAILKPKTENEILKEYLHLPEVPFNYSNPDLPAFFSNQFVTFQKNTPPDNQTTDWGATLGRVLFYDNRLSGNYSISCSSCHNQEFGFTDTAQFSVGFQGGLSKRHSMSLINAAYYSSGRFFWDERAATLEEQVLIPVQDGVEMGMRLDSLENRLRQTAFYPVLFKYAFGSHEISSVKISKALAQFVRSIISYRSKYDEGRAITNDREDDFSNYTMEENLGKKIFMTHKEVNCSGCHNTDVFIMDNPRNNGISLNNDDEGIFVHTRNSADMGKFKSPSLKNVALRTHFMHDGSLRGLSAVLNHYNSNIKPNPNLDAHLINLTNGSPLTMNLSPGEINALLAFLETLTDHKIIKDEKYSSPFR